LPDLLLLPFANASGTEISEGWIYSEVEQNIHHHQIHFAVDFKLARNTPIYSPVDGYAVSSYQSFYLDTLYEEKRVGYGLGYFVELWDPAAGVFMSLCHLEKISAGIYYMEPKRGYSSGFDTWDPVLIYKSLEEKLKNATVIKRGDVIGYSGSSGLSWGFQEGPRLVPNDAELKSWDEPHLHLEVYTRKLHNKKWVKDKRFDPYGIYSDYKEYSGAQREMGLWLVDNNGLPLHAK
jgi:murein DD-endopeptidase MepM/ murein hydrolase activator NlpD